MGKETKSCINCIHMRIRDKDGSFGGYPKEVYCQRKECWIDLMDACSGECEYYKKQPEKQKYMFRGKKEEDGEGEGKDWITGAFTKADLNDDSIYLTFSGFWNPNTSVRIRPGTLCQQTGFVDKGRSKIYENDILEARLNPDEPMMGYRMVVKWKDGGWVLVPVSTDDIIIDLTKENASGWIVIGNSIDHPELMQAGRALHVADGNKYTNDFCKIAIRGYYDKASPTDSDLSLLKTFGKDAASAVKPEELQKIAEEKGIMDTLQAAFVLPYKDERDKRVETSVRWWLRGLKLEDSMKKAQAEYFATLHAIRRH